MGKRSRKERRKERAAEKAPAEAAVAGSTKPVEIGIGEAAAGAAPKREEPRDAALPEEAGEPGDQRTAGAAAVSIGGVGESGVDGKETSAEAERLREGLARSRRGWVSPLARIIARRRFDEGFWEEVEEILIGADVGLEMTALLVDMLRDRIARDRIREADEAMRAFAEEIESVLRMEGRALRYAPEGPSVWLVVGVNGTGKTTTIAKLAHMIKSQGGKVLLAAGDTFRAAGIEQLEIWGERVGVHTVKHRPGADAAAVAYDAVQSAKARNVDVVIVDTAGRLHTKVNLMEELKKIKRVAAKEAPVTETLLVHDATTG